MYDFGTTNVFQPQNYSELNDTQLASFNQMKKTYLFAGKDSTSFLNVKIVLQDL